MYAIYTCDLWYIIIVVNCPLFHQVYQWKARVNVKGKAVLVTGTATFMICVCVRLAGAPDTLLTNQ